MTNDTTTEDLIENIETKKLDNSEHLEDLEEAENKFEDLKNRLQDVFDRHKNRDSGIDESTRELIDNISLVKMYETGTIEIHFKREEKIPVYLLKNFTVKSVDFDRNYIRV